MAKLLVRGVDEAVVRALKQQAGVNGRSTEAEHRAILEAALARPRKRSFAEVLAAVPNVGTDADFERVSASTLQTGLRDSAAPIRRPYSGF